MPIRLIMCYSLKGVQCSPRRSLPLKLRPSNTLDPKVLSLMPIKAYFRWELLCLTCVWDMWKTNTSKPIWAYFSSRRYRECAWNSLVVLHYKGITLNQRIMPLAYRVAYSVLVINWQWVIDQKNMLSFHIVPHCTTFVATSSKLLVLFRDKRV